MIQHFWLFAMTAFILNITPGNDMLYVMARSTGQGTRAGVVSALGIMLGCMVHIIAAMIGLSALIARSAATFTIIKYAGAAYLIYLGVKALLKNVNINDSTFHTSVPLKKVFWQGMLTNALNPKVALFFLAFLPQFIDVRYDNPLWPIFLLGLWFNTGGTVINILVALLFGKVRSYISGSGKYVIWQQKITGIILISLGIKIAIATKK